LNSTDDRKQSRRKSLRFSGNNLPVHYKTRFEEGRGRLENISTEGCSITAIDTPVSLEETILIALTLEDMETLEARARVIRVENDHLAALFTVIEPASVNLLRSYFIQKMRTNKSETQHTKSPD